MLDGGRDRTNPFATARHNETVMRPLAKLLWTIVKGMHALLSKFEMCNKFVF